MAREMRRGKREGERGRFREKKSKWENGEGDREIDFFIELF